MNASSRGADNEIARLRQLYLDNPGDSSIAISIRSRVRHGLLKFINGPDREFANEAREVLKVINDDADAVYLADELVKNGKSENLVEALRLYKLAYAKSYGLDTAVSRKVMAGLKKMSSLINESEDVDIQQIASEAVLALGDIYLENWKRVTPAHVEVKNYFKMIDRACELLLSRTQTLEERLAIDDKVQKMKIDLLTIAAPDDVKQYDEVNSLIRKSKNLFVISNSIYDRAFPTDAQVKLSDMHFKEAVVTLKQAIQRSKNPELVVANVQIPNSVFERKAEDKIITLLVFSNDEVIGPLAMKDLRMRDAITQWCRSTDAMSYLLDEEKRDNLFRNVLLEKYKMHPNPVAIHFAEQIDRRLKKEHTPGLKNAYAVFLKLNSQFSKASLPKKPVRFINENVHVTTWSVNLFSLFRTKRGSAAIELTTKNKSAANDNLSKLKSGRQK